MAGFLLQSSLSECKWPISLVKDTPSKEFISGNYRLAVTETFDSKAAGLYLFKDGTAWIEGLVLVMPKGQEFGDWLISSDGSFRGVFFSSSGDSAIAFSDPYASRPIYYVNRKNLIAVSDKVASLVALGGGAIDWAVILEALAVGSVYSFKSSIDNVFQLKPGCAIHYNKNGFETWEYRPLSVRSSNQNKNSIITDAVSLSSAVNAMIREVCRDNDAYLFLSGGYDSRWVLNKLPEPRKCITVVPGECYEKKIAAEVALKCGAKQIVSVTSRLKWGHMVRASHYLTGAIYEPLKMTLSDSPYQWHSMGVSSVITALLFDTFFKGYFVFSGKENELKHSNILDNPIAQLCYRTMGSEYYSALSQVLSEEGACLLKEQIDNINRTTEWDKTGGNYHGIERRIFGCISRQNDWPMNLALMEYFNVYSPVFHNKAWDWWCNSNPRNRRPCVSFLLAFIFSNLEIAFIPKGDTRQNAFRLLMRLMASRYLSQRLKEALNMVFVRKRVRKPIVDNMSNRSAWGVDEISGAIRQEESKRFIVENIQHLFDVKLFRKSALQEAITALDDKQEWSDRLTCFLASIGAWKDFVENGNVDKVVATNTPYMYETIILVMPDNRA